MAELPLPPPGNAPDAPAMLTLPSLAICPSVKALLEAIQACAKLRGYASITSKRKKIEDRRYKVYYACEIFLKPFTFHVSGHTKKCALT